MSFWETLKQQTHARIGLKRAGNSLSTQELLDFRLAHSRAKDSVWRDLDLNRVQAEVKSLGVKTFTVQSQCENKQEFLLRPDRGKKLNLGSEAELASTTQEEKSMDCLLILADGLSAAALERQALSFLNPFLEAIQKQNLSVGPVIIARYARVALGDKIASFFQARSVLVLIGERPGLASPQSLGVYYTFSPSSSTSDADRNCISNIQDRGLHPEIAAEVSVSLITQSLKQQLGGVKLKLQDRNLSISLNS